MDGAVAVNEGCALAIVADRSLGSLGSLGMLCDDCVERSAPTMRNEDSSDGAEDEAAPPAPAPASACSHTGGRTKEGESWCSMPKCRMRAVSREDTSVALLPSPVFPSNGDGEGSDEEEL